MNPKIRSLFFACLGLLFGMSVMFVYNNFIADKKTDSAIENKKKEVLPKTAVKFIQ